MSTWFRANLRNDVLTAAVIDHGLAMQGIAGPVAAYNFLLQQRVPIAIICRVMACPRERRQAGVVGIAPASR
ncbi:hypothetical protein [Massilia eburnea]|uniref:hypothetical protein n=1 Tax=Massilia eburnea TaxID=1776165 RepID=UPI0014789072|nr:hypothetical protein [Massilia eburnea]